MKEVFDAWDRDHSGFIGKEEITAVLMAIMPGFTEADVRMLVLSIDTNADGALSYEEFCDWISKADPLAANDSGSFESLVASLMHDAGKSLMEGKRAIRELQIHEEGIFMIRADNTASLTTNAATSVEVQLLPLEIEEFIQKIELADGYLIVTMNTGKQTKLTAKGPGFGPWEATEGFAIAGLRTKPSHAGSTDQIVCGIVLEPLPWASNYDATSAVAFAASEQYMETLRRLLSRALVDENSFGPGFVTPLMIAAERGAVGSMRLLISCKAQANISDSEGWTALTYASQRGHASSVEFLLSKGATQDGDGGIALSHAIRNHFNSGARALLQAGFGHASKGAFRIEPLPEEKAYELPAPVLNPLSGAFTKMAPVSLTAAGEDVEGVHILYTTDGRDPALSGMRYKSPLQMSKHLTILRAVAIRAGHRSAESHGIYRLCHYKVPDEVVTGTIKARVYPAAAAAVRASLSLSLETCGAVNIVMKPIDAGGNPRWLQMKLNDLKPRYRLRIDRPFARVKNAVNKKAFVDKVTADILAAVGEAPHHVDISHGSIILDFEMSRDKATELGLQLQNPLSMLRSMAKMKDIFAVSKLEHLGSLEDKISDLAFKNKVAVALGFKSAKDASISSVGKGDTGVVAVLARGLADAKSMRSKIARVLTNDLSDVEGKGNCEEFPEFCEIQFSADFASGDKSLGEAYKDCAQLLKDINGLTIMLGIQWKAVAQDRRLPLNTRR